MTATTAAKSSSKTSNKPVDEDIDDEREPVVLPALKSAAVATGHGLHAAGRAVADADLRKLGRGLKAIGRKVPKVRFEKRTQDS
jgi:hypothetical protein